jgi:hypothetical protein
MPHSLDQRQAQADGHLNQQSSLLVRQEAAGRPVPMNPQTRPTQSPTQSSSSTKSDDGFRSFGPPSGGSGQAKPQARVWEAQGTPEPEKKTNAQPANSAQHAQQWSHPLAKPVAPVQPGNERQQKEQEQKFSTWQQQRPAASAPAPRQQNSHPPAESHASSPKKGN